MQNAKYTLYTCNTLMWKNKVVKNQLYAQKNKAGPNIFLQILPKFPPPQKKKKFIIGTHFEEILTYTYRLDTL